MSETKPRLDGEVVELVDELRDRIKFLEGELQRKEAIMLNMTEAMKALTPPATQAEPQ